MVFLQLSRSSSSTPSSSSSSLIIVSTLSSKSNTRSFKLPQLRNKSHISYSPFHHYNQMHQPTTITNIYNFHKTSAAATENEFQIIRHNKLLSELSTWGIGGPCKYFVQVSNLTQLISAVRYCNEHSIRFIIIGKGSNCLFDDHGFDGCVILNHIGFVERVQPGVYRVGSGYAFNRLGVQCCNEGYSGLEFAAGIPGTVGGAAFMNAGANGQETADVIDSVEIVTVDGRLKTLNREELSFGYRKSVFQDMEDLAAVTAVTFCLIPSVSAKEQQQTILAKRKMSQPLGQRSAGSVFQNPLGFSAGDLIEKAGLKGFRVGGAKVSEIHANFFINSGNSTSRDMIELINLAKEKVNAKFGIQLQEEIRYVNACNGINCNRYDSPTV